MAHPHVDDLANFLVVPHVLPSSAHYWFDTFICSRHGNFRFDRLPKWVICSCLPLNSHLDNCLPQFLRNIAVNYLGDTAGLYKLPLRRVTRSCLGRHQAGDGCIHASAGPKWHLLAVRKSLSPSLSHSVDSWSGNWENWENCRGGVSHWENTLSAFCFSSNELMCLAYELWSTLWQCENVFNT